MLLIFGLLFVGLLAMQYASLNLNQTGVALRKGLTGLLFSKALRLSMSSVAEATTGKLINLCSGDMALIESYAVLLPAAVTGPCSILLAFTLLYLTVGAGPTIFILLLAMILFFIQFPVNTLILRLRLRINSASDDRLSLLHTLVKGILTVKGYGWEQPLIARARAARKEEVSRLRRFHQLSGCFQGLLLYFDPALALPILFAPTLSGQPLEGASVFVAISLAASLSFNGITMANQCVTSLANYLSVFQRGQQFLSLPERDTHPALPIHPENAL